MQVIIPAAGLGSRLRPHTDDRPKCMVPVGGKPIIEQTLAQLRDLGCEHVVCVVGYRADLLEEFVGGLKRRPPVTFVRNEQYATTNSMASLQVSFSQWDAPTAIVDSDILVSDRLLKLLLGGTGDAMVIDPERARDEIDMAAEVRDGRIWHLDKQLPEDRTSGEFFGLSRWSARGAARLQDTVEALVRAGGAIDWYQFAIRRLAKTFPIEVLAARRHEWVEIDTAADLAVAEKARVQGADWGRP
ncbi:phosphocholine cytidylyltransferase family protein [Micromonospora sp. WMMD1082]|uniref:phosphocholine cytidylyltransferase family protein n=1 Tax=Micromonospora sp. WMMD1082 TaxID=3016104 RepID=UPI0024176B3B|nr:phosphocholine cytidylyltransferase family protein [Micromonospora sp. WMMD1082]MDG4795536.1 phosphocholine cytidylyltransferase family protein [Micromonospora sp. WMMD1082]